MTLTPQIIDRGRPSAPAETIKDVCFGQSCFPKPPKLDIMRFNCFPRHRRKSAIRRMKKQDFHLTDAEGHPAIASDICSYLLGHGPQAAFARRLSILSRHPIGRINHDKVSRCLLRLQPKCQLSGQGIHQGGAGGIFGSIATPFQIDLKSSLKLSPVDHHAAQTRMS